MVRTDFEKGLQSLRRSTGGKEKPAKDMARERLKKSSLMTA